MSDISFDTPRISGENYNRLKMQVDNYNKTVGQGREMKQELDKDAFLTILLQQLTHQDPTKPMEDKEFIAQMAQFSSLEQMKNMTAEMAKISQMVNQNSAISMLGKTVEVFDGKEMLTGKVDKISNAELGLIYIDGQSFEISQVQNIIEN
ncbi:MAG: flagellar hook assembly protein FlgD [Spirochaetales bacterium]|nr:flagellar hook assembly protein FlgD [Spirochaetales bacterium]